MRILRVSHRLFPDDIGGGEYHIHALSRDQAAMGHDVTVLKISDSTDQVYRDQRHGYEVVYCPSTITLLKNEISIAAARKLFSANEFDVIHAHSHFYFSTNLAALKRRLGKIPLAITSHSVYSQSVSERLFSYYLRTAGKWTLNSADTVFCYTPEERGKLRELGVRSDIEVIANGIDEDRFHPDGPTHDAIDTEVPSVLFVGRLVEGKGPGYAIEAIERVRETHPDATLYIVGYGPLRSELEQEVSRRNLESDVQFLGQIDYDEMPTVFRAADVLMLPSRAEGFPRVVMEAMASETPVVCTALDQIESAIDGAGFTAPFGDTAGYSSGVIRLLDDADLRREFGRRGREIVEENFSWSETAERTTRQLRELVA